MDRKYKGVITPVVTPLQEDFSLDKQGLSNVIEHMIAGGVHGLFILGTTGQGPHLSHAFRKETILETVKISNGRLPVIVGVTDTKTMVQRLLSWQRHTIYHLLRTNYHIG